MSGETGSAWSSLGSFLIGSVALLGFVPVILMFNDNAWGVLKGYQKDRFGGRNMATDLVNPDFIKLFESYGIEGTRVSSVSDLTRALENAIPSDSIQLIEVETPNGFGALV